MTSLIDFAEMDLRGAFDFAIMVEEDAQLRYEDFVRLLGDDPGGAGDVFRMMVANERKHRDQLVARRDAACRDGAPLIEISMTAEGVERPLLEGDELPRTARDALKLALAAERRSYDFYRRVVPHLKEPAVHAFFEELMQEEAEHAELLARRIANLEVSAAERAQPRPPPALVVAPAAYPDRARLEAALPRFDAATRAVATGVIVHGMRQDEVATALGVSRRAVASKLARFLAFARQHAAVAVAAAALTGCGGGLAMTDAPARSMRAELQRDAPSAAVEGHAPARERQAQDVGGRDGRAGEVEREGEGEAPVDVLAIVPLRVGDPGNTPTVRKPDEEDDVVAPQPILTPAAETEVKPSPAVDDVWPDKAPAAGGQRVVIRGKNLRAARVVFGITLADVIEATDEKLTVVVPAAEPGPASISVTNADGNYVLTSTTFRYYR